MTYQSVTTSIKRLSSFIIFTALFLTVHSCSIISPSPAPVDSVTVRRSFTSSKKLLFSKSVLTSCPHGTVITLKEETYSRTKSAEIRTENGIPGLWIKHGNQYYRATQKDYDWLNHFLCCFSFPQELNSGKTIYASRGHHNLFTHSGAIINKVAGMNFQSRRSSFLKKEAGRVPLSPDRQLQIINSAMLQINFDSEKVKILINIIENPCFSNEARQAIFESIESIPQKAHQKDLIKALLKNSFKRAWPADTCLCASCRRLPKHTISAELKKITSAKNPLKKDLFVYFDENSLSQKEQHIIIDFIFGRFSSAFDRNELTASLIQTQSLSCTAKHKLASKLYRAYSKYMTPSVFALLKQ